MTAESPGTTALVAMRSVAGPRRFPPEECAAAVDFLVRAFTGAGPEGMRRRVRALGREVAPGEAERTSP
ncbi:MULTISPECIES: hypothetical protein [unclassified Streptomyces]|uniref:hypothetical protein n=1 Tax=unclassified Streptomyces TaxID=2593676 RepID=UPI0037003272